MSEQMIRILLVDDDKIDRMAFQRYVSKTRLPYNITVAKSRREALEKIKDKYDVALIDHDLGDGTGLEVLPHLEDLPSIFITGGGSEQIAIEAMRNGALDYLVKDPDRNYLKHLPSTIRNVIERKQAEEALRKSEERYRTLAEFSNAVIHNVGNVLNSISASCEIIGGFLVKTKLGQLEKVLKLIEEHKQESKFFSEHPKGRQLPEYMSRLNERLVLEQDAVSDEIKNISKNLLLIREAIQAQQSQGKVSEVSEDILLKHVITDAIKVRKSTIQKNGIKVSLQIEPGVAIKTRRIKLTHILVNLIKNAVDAIMAHPDSRRLLNIEGGVNDKGAVFIRIQDTGVGINKDNFQQLFQHGFTTKKTGHGYGLHYCEAAMKELGGCIRAESQGEGMGATFFLEFNKPTLENNDAPSKSTRQIVG